jgi:hypothetical protein
MPVKLWLHRQRKGAASAHGRTVYPKPGSAAASPSSPARAWGFALPRNRGNERARESKFSMDSNPWTVAQSDGATEPRARRRRAPRAGRGEEVREQGHLRGRGAWESTLLYRRAYSSSYNSPVK